MRRKGFAAALAACGGKVSGKGEVAGLLGMRPSTLASRIKALGLDARRAPGGPP